MRIDNLNIKLKYQSFIDNPIDEFYIPVLSNSVVYKRTIGYFSSSVLLDYVKGLRNFYKNSGQIQLIISPYISKTDKNTINNVYNIEITRQELDELFYSFLTDKQLFTSAKLLFLFLKSNKMEIKVAEPINTIGLFHDKIGLFSDDYNNKIAIIGSNNETSSALKENIESFNTFCSWKSGQNEYILQHEIDFERYWSGENKTIKVYTLEEALSNELFSKFQTKETFEELFDSLMEEPTTYGIQEEYNVIPRDYQEKAVNEWFKNNKGIFKFATGAGKTKTAIYLMERLEKIINKNYFVIVVPDKTLVNQWSEELESINKTVIRCYSATPSWNIKLKDTIDMASRLKSYNNYIVVTNDSYISSKFQKELKKLNNNYTLIVDECHGWGTELILESLPDPIRRLGLSATPELFYSEIKTEKLLDFFGGIIAEYSLENAINDGRLVNYKYYPIYVSLTDSEKEEYNEITKTIVKMIGRDVDDKSDKSSQYGQALDKLLFKRARIVYGASNKLIKLKEIVTELSKKKNLIVYCGPTSYLTETEDETTNISLTQLEAVNNLLYKCDIKFAQYTSQENELQRKQALSSFTSGTYSTLVAIKCLDEGINIPQIERAIIMASSSNPREFIQRRGRILRTHPNKKMSEIYDLVVFDSDTEAISKKELKRVREFMKIAINRDEIISQMDTSIKNIFNEVIIDGE